MKKVYEIYREIESHDCWGNYETSYEPSGNIYTSYDEAKRHVGDGKIEEKTLYDVPVRTAEDLEKLKNRRERWKKHCEVISKKAKLNEQRSIQSIEAAKKFISD